MPITFYPSIYPVLQEQRQVQPPDERTAVRLDLLLAHVAEGRVRRGHRSTTPVPHVDPTAPAPWFRVRVAHQLKKVATTVYLFNKARVSFGRAGDNDVPLNSPEGTLSRYHFEIQYEDRTFWLVDVNSRNATVIQGKPLEPAERYVLLEGDTFEAGDFVVTFLGTMRGE